MLPVSNQSWYNMDLFKKTRIAEKMRQEGIYTWPETIGEEMFARVKLISNIDRSIKR